MRWLKFSEIKTTNSDGSLHIDKIEDYWRYSLPKENLISDMEYKSIDDLKFFLSISNTHRMRQNGQLYIVATDSLGYVNKRMIK